MPSIRPGPIGATPGVNLATQAELDAHAADTTAVHGIADTSALETTTGSAAKVAAHEADTTNVHGIADTSALATAAAVAAAYVPLSQRAAANGVATLDGSVTIPDAQIPAAIARDAEVAAAYAPLSSPTLTTPSAKTAQDTAVLGSELVTGGAWTFTGTAVASGDGGQFAAGGGTMWQNITVTSGQAYVLAWTQTGASAGSRNVQIGAVEQQGGITAYYGANSAYIVASATGSVALTFTGDATYNGKITAVTVKALTGPSVAALALKDSGGTVRGELRSDSLANTAAGLDALRQVTTGGNNTAAGYAALRFNTTGATNTAAGAYSLYSNTTGGYNTAAGANALRSNTTGGYNTAAGYYALYTNTTGGYNTAAGYYALYTNTTGGSNTAAGANALYTNTTGSSNTAAGANALRSNTTGSYNTADGAEVLRSNTTGGNNTAAGYAALYANTTGGSNTAAGQAAGYTATPANATVTGSRNVFLGVETGPANTSDPSDAVAVGYRALVGAQYTVAIGRGANATNTGSVAIGVDSGGTGASATVNNAIALGTANHLVQIKNNTTGAGSAALGSNSPAVTPAAPYTWFKMLSSDGSTVYVPAWK